jgi:hypothetical protein
MNLLSGAVRPVFEVWGREPVALQGLILIFVNLLFVFSVIHLTVPQIGAINMFLVAFFAFLARGGGDSGRQSQGRRRQPAGAARAMATR